MARISRFEDIEAWVKARRLVGDIYRITKAGNFMKDYILRTKFAGQEFRRC